MSSQFHFLCSENLIFYKSQYLINGQSKIVPDFMYVMAPRRKQIHLSQENASNITAEFEFDRRFCNVENRSARIQLFFLSFSGITPIKINRAIWILLTMMLNENLTSDFSEISIIVI